MLPAWLAWLPKEARLGAVIEHTLLRPDAGLEEVLRLCAEARGLGCRAVCVHGQWLPACRGELCRECGASRRGGRFSGRSGNHRRSRVAEVARLAEAGADEIDIVAPLAALAAGDWAGGGAGPARRDRGSRQAGQGDPRDRGARSRCNRHGVRNRSRRRGIRGQDLDRLPPRRRRHGRGGAPHARIGRARPQGQGVRAGFEPSAQALALLGGG